MNKGISIYVEGFGTIHVYSTFIGECKGNKMFNLTHYTHKLHIWSAKGEMFCVFHDCAANYPKVKQLSKESLLNALDCILSDISMYLNDEIEDCCDNVASYRAAVKGCKKEYEDFTKVVGSDDDYIVWDLIMKLTDYIRGKEEEDEE